MSPTTNVRGDDDGHEKNDGKAENDFKGPPQGIHDIATRSVDEKLIPVEEDRDVRQRKPSADPHGRGGRATLYRLLTALQLTSVSSASSTSSRKF